MCGRFYVDDEMLNEIEKILKRIDRENVKSGDIYPTDNALVIKASEGEMGIAGDLISWGYKLEPGHKLIFNARSETVGEKPLFRKDFFERRCVVPARGFYEWDKSKNKYLITSNDSEIIYMAGIYRNTKDGGQFTILTEDAKGVLKKIHERMPLLISKCEIKDWIEKRNFVAGLESGAGRDLKLEARN